jgi:predicted amidohydrolase
MAIRPTTGNVALMRVAVAQVPSVSEGVLDVISPRVAEAAGQGADLVVLPEGVMHDFRPDVDLAAIAEPLDGRFASAIRNLAGIHGVAIVAGMWEKVDGDPRPSNTLLAVGPDGGTLATYRKVHLFDSFGFVESERVLPGAPGATTFDLGGLTHGLMTCYDLRFPELARALSSAGADVLVLPAGWIAGPDKLHHWQTLLTARAIENTAYVVAAALCEGGYTGHSRVIDPMGKMVAALADWPAVAVADIGAERIAEVRDVIPSLRHRRM